MQSLLLLFLLLQDTPRETFESRLAEIPDGDVKALYELGVWCEERRLWDLARDTFLQVLEKEPEHKGAARAKEKIWIYRAAVARGVKFPSKEEIEAVRKKGRNHRRMLEVFLDLDNWVESLRRFDECTGLFRDSIDITVIFATMNKPASGLGRGGTGKIRLDLDRLAKYQKEIDRIERGRKSGATVAIPPAKPERILTHELTHCFQAVKQPEWFLEGMATFAQNDPHYVAYFRDHGQKVKDITVETELKYAYPRGWAFFEFFLRKHGRKKLHELFRRTIRERTPVEKASAEVSGLKWEALVSEEKSWSRSWMENYRIPD